MNALILAAGYGKRLAPITDYIPKALISLQGKAILYYLLNKLYRQNFKSIIVNVYHHADQVVSFINNYNIEHNTNVQISVEDKLLDTGGGIKKMLTLLDNDKDTLVHNVDILSNVDLETFYKQHLDSNSSASLAVQGRETTRPLLFDENMQLCGKKSKHEDKFNIIRHPSGTLLQWAFCGIQVIKPELFLNYPIDRFYSIDVYTKNAARNKSIMGKSIDNYFWKDLGTSKDIKDAEKQLDDMGLSAGQL